MSAAGSPLPTPMDQVQLPTVCASPAVGVAIPAVVAGRMPSCPAQPATGSNTSTKASLDSLMARLSSIDSELDDLRLSHFAARRPRTQPLQPEAANKFDADANEGKCSIAPELDANNANESQVPAAQPPATPTTGSAGREDEAEAIFNSVMQRLALVESRQVETVGSPFAAAAGATETRKRPSARDQGGANGHLPIEATEMVETLRNYQSDGQDRPAATDQLLSQLFEQLKGASGSPSVETPAATPQASSSEEYASENVRRPTRASSKKQRVRSSRTSPARPDRSQSSQSPQRTETTVSEQSCKNFPSEPSTPCHSALLGQHQHTLAGLIGHLQQLTEALKHATGATISTDQQDPTLEFLSESRADMQEVVHTALADLSADLSSKPTAAPTAHLSVDDLMARANKLCSEVAANAAAPAPTFDCEASKMAPSCHDLPLVDEDILSADCEFGLDSWAHGICLASDDLDHLHFDADM